ncbi:MAG: EAL domain-containing protein [Micromonosporaceae bacterium]|nr:EAL domain-containing protein [Micromonosporaceae bacterium]
MQPTSLRNSAPSERAGRFYAYLTVVIAAALAVAAPFLADVPSAAAEAPVAFWLMAVLALVLDTRPFVTPGPRQSAAVYPSVCFVFAIMLMWGLGLAVVTLVALVAAHAWLHGRSATRTAFNLGQYVASFGVAHGVLAGLGGLPLLPVGWRQVAVLALAAAAWFVTSHLLVSTAIWLRFGGDWRRIVRRSAGYEALSWIGLLLLAPLVVAAADQSTWLVPLVVAPLYAAHRAARLSQEHEQLALLDSLTGLANRKALRLRIDSEIAGHVERVARHAASRAGATGEAPERLLALLLLDLDRFKDVNDTLGHGVGDRLLVEVAHRLSREADPDHVVARLGGDEFAILAPDLDEAAAMKLGQRIGLLLSEPVQLDGMPLDVHSSIGVVTYPEQGEDYATLMRHAEVAMYQAKARGDTVATYLPEADHHTAERLGLLGELRHALESPRDSGIELYYQPQVAIASGEVVAVEALLRWRHPERGNINPEELIRIAEHSAVMRLLTFHVLGEVTRQLAAWAAEGLVVRAAVNVSVRDLHAPDFADHLAALLDDHQLKAAQVQLEITEGALMADPRRVLATLRRLDELGVALSLDDFGTGYSSMLHLRRLPLAEVKIDRSFVLGMANDDDDASIVRSIIELAGALGLRVVAEGVEDERTWRRLAAQGCHVAQGWFYARPMPAGELPGWLAQYRPPRLLRSASRADVAT